MKRIITTLSILSIAATALAQDPTPPTPPARPARPAATPAPASTPSPAIAPMVPVGPIDVHIGAGAGWGMGVGDINVNIGDIRAQVEDAMRDVDWSSVQAAKAMAQSVDVDAARFAADEARMQVDMARSQVAMAAATVPSFNYNYNFNVSPGWISPFDRAMAPAAWAQGDPADSLYRLARETMNNGDYRRAAQLFADINKQYPKSEYTNTALYYQALSRYRLGSTEELKAAAKALQPLYASDATASSCNGFGQGQGYSFGYSTPMAAAVAGTPRPGPAPRPRLRCAGDMDVSGLYLRINGVLADRGDRDAAAIVAEEAKKAGNSSSCDQEDQRVRLEALNALVQMDPASAMPLIKKVLDRKDECSNELRRQAVFMLGRRGDAESNNLLISLAKSDPSTDVRTTAIMWLPRIQGDASFTTLEEILRTDTDERVQRAAVQALMSSDSPKAHQSMRTLIERNDAPINLREEAIRSFNKDHGSPDDAAYLRNLYTKVDNDRLKRAIIDAIGRMGDADSDAWLLALAKNQNELSQYRSAAVGRLTRSTTPIADLVKLWDLADSRSLRDQVINALRSRKEPESTDKLIAIAKDQTVDYSLRSAAIRALASKNDPRSQAALTELLNKP